MFGTFFALLTAFANDRENINQKGFFFGYTKLVWLNILVQSGGGLLVAIVIKYADNILKGFATSAAIVVSCIASVYLFNTRIDLMFALGTLLVVVSVFLYSYTPKSLSGVVATAQLLPVSSSSAGSNVDTQDPSSPIGRRDIELVKYSSGSLITENEIKRSTS